MKNEIGFAIAGLALCIGPAQAASSVPGSYSLQLTVAPTCTVRHTPGLMQLGSGAYGLGALKEYCNVPQGYNVLVNYAPGTMKGAIIALGGDSVVLDGSGTAVVSRAPGPRIKDRALIATPGAAGFDTDVLSFQAVAN
ncbi:MAG: hypothetical protein JWQ16_1918 [Novosphingobium sp.]|nr:hypothetical protein [Novosphingobium sp.]